MEWEVGEPLHVNDSASCHARGPPFGYSVYIPLRGGS